VRCLLVSFMNKFETLIRGILWLAKKDWGLAFLLAFAAFVAIIGIGAQQPGGHLETMFEGPIFTAGLRAGMIVFPDYATRGTAGFYVAPLFGAAPNFLVLMAFWFIVVKAVRRLWPKKQDG